MKAVGTVVLLLIALLVVLVLVLSIPAVQRGLGHWFSDVATATLGAEVRIGSVYIQPLGPLILEDVYVGDLRGDTLFDVQRLKVSGFRPDVDRRMISITAVELRGGRFALARHPDDAVSNLTGLLERLGSSDTTSSGGEWRVQCGRFAIEDLHFSFHDGHVEQSLYGVDFDHVDVSDAHIAGRRLVFAGDSVTAWLEQLRLKERSGLVIDQLSGVTKVGPRGIVIEDMVLRTPSTDVKGRLDLSTTSWSDFSYFSDRVLMRVDLQDSRVEFADIAFFAPGLRGIQLPISVHGKVRGTLAELKGRGLDVRFGDHSSFKGNAELSGLPDVENTFMLIDIDGMHLDPRDLERLPRPPFEEGRSLDPPYEVRELGAVDFRGNFTGFPRSFTAYGTAATALGALRTDLSFERDTTTKAFSLSGRLATEAFRPGVLLRTDLLGPMAANVRIKAHGRQLSDMTADVEGTFPMFTFNGRTVKGLVANGRLERNLFNGALSVNDDGLMLDFEGLADLRGRWPEVDFTADVKLLDLTALGIAPFEGYNTVRMGMSAKGRLSPDSLLGKLEFTDIMYCHGDDAHELGDVVLGSLRRDGENVLYLDASFAKAEVIGTFLPTKLAGAFTNVVYSVFPALRTEFDPSVVEQDFRFDVTVLDAEAILALVQPGLSIDSGSVVSGALDSRTLDMGLHAVLPRAGYGPLEAHSIEVVLDKTFEILAFSINSDLQQWNDSIWFAGTSLTGKAYQDELEFSLGWDDSDSGTNGDLDLLGEVRASGIYSLDLLPSHLQFGRGDWVNLRTAHAEVDHAEVRIDSLILLNEGQRIALDGAISKDPSVPLRFDLRDVSLSNLAPFVPGPMVEGALSGEGAVHDLLGSPYVISYLCLDGLELEDEPIGDLRFAATWKDGQKAIDLNGDLNRGAIKALDFSGELVMGEEQALDLKLVMDRFDLAFIDPYLPEGLSEIQGLVTGDLHVGGNVTDPRIEGELQLQDAGMRIDYLNTLYTFSHTVKVEPDMFAFDLVTVRDEMGNTGRIGGTIQHTGLKDWNYNVWGHLEGMLVLNTRLEQNDLYYGRAFATGDFDLGGFEGNMEITVDARTAPGTEIHFPVGGSTDVSDVGFVHFKSGDSTDTAEPTVDLSGIALDMDVEVTPDALFELIFDPTVGDILSGRGLGNMEMSVTPAGEFDMRGQVEVINGDYLFTLRNVVNKRFQVEPGGRIVWYGDPFDAQLDLEAVYRVRAPLYDIMFEKNDVYRKRVPVDVVMRLKDKLLNPEIAFNVRLPSVDESVRTQVNSVLSTEQELNRQVFALIVLNRFVQPPNYTGAGTPGGANVAGTTTSELLSNQVSNWLSSLSNDFDLGLNYRPGDNVTQDEVEVAVSTQLFDERLLLSTNVGVQYGAQSARNSNALVGDFQVEYLMTNDGKLRLKAFSISNDRNLNRADQALTTQGAGVAYREEFNTFGEFWQKLMNIFRTDEKDRKFN